MTDSTSEQEADTNSATAPKKWADYVRAPCGADAPARDVYGVGKATADALAVAGFFKAAQLNTAWADAQKNAGSDDADAAKEAFLDWLKEINAYRLTIIDLILFFKNI